MPIMPRAAAEMSSSEPVVSVVTVVDYGSEGDLRRAEVRRRDALDGGSGMLISSTLGCL